MYVMDRHSNKKNTKHNYRNKNQTTWDKKNPGKKLNEIYIIAFHFVRRTSVNCLALYLYQEKLFS